jgi:uncharacterized membrane protein YkoI
MKENLFSLHHPLSRAYYPGTHSDGPAAVRLSNLPIQENTMRRLRDGLMAGVVLCVLAGMTARADEEKEGKVALDKVPQAVLKAVKDKFKGAELVSAATEKDEGKLIYEIVIKHEGHSIDVSVTPDGKIVSAEKTIAVKDLPKEVAEALDSKYARAKIKRVEEIAEGDKVSYEVLLVTADNQTVEVVFDPKGKVVKEEKKEAKKEKD